jgi:hypothetical protein
MNIALVYPKGNRLPKEFDNVINKQMVDLTHLIIQKWFAVKEKYL